MPTTYELMRVCPGDVPELDAYLVKHEDMVYFVLGDPKERPGQRYVAGYPATAIHMASRFRSRWEVPQAGETVPGLVVRRIEDYESKRRELPKH